MILLAPLFVYLVYMKNIYSIENEIFLKEKSLLIIKSMEEYNPNDLYFEYPRFKTIRSGLYDARLRPVFTLIDEKIKNFKNGYYIDDDDQAYLTIQLPKERYFGSDYLILTNKISYASLYMNVATILFSIIILVFFFSILILNRFAKPFRELNKQLDKFIKDSIHEINTPLAIINVNIDLYNRKNPPNKYFQRIKAATKVLSNIYDDMDYLIKYNRLEYENETIELGHFISERVEYFDDVAQMKQVTIKHKLEDGIFVSMNPKKLRKIIDNNLSNAIKYSFENTEIEVELYIKSDTCYFIVRDHGIGIKNVDKILSRYYREDKSKGGFGIGLNIVKSIIREYDIELQIDSKLQVGSTFIYKFPKKLLLNY